MNRYHIVSIIAFLTIFEVNFFGRMLLSEAVIPFLMIFYFKPKYHLTKIIIIILSLALVWLMSAMLTDFYRQSAAEDYLRGWAKIVFFTINFCFLYAVINKNIKVAIFAIYAFLIISCVRLYLGVGGVTFGKDIFGTGWKFGYGQFFTATAFILIAFFKNRLIIKATSPFIVFAASLFDLAMNARNLFMISFLSSSVSALSYTRKRSISPQHIAAILLVVFVAAFGAKSLYSFSAEAGLLGDLAKAKYETQSSGKYGLLLGGRNESLVSIQAIKDSPILGHGSWARDWEYARLRQAVMHEGGYEVNDGAVMDNLIPTHSLIFGAWVEHGLAGAVFWMAAIIITLMGLYQAIRWPTVWSGFIIFVGLGLFWDIWFSPLGLERRIVTPLWLCLMIIMIENGKKFHMEQNQLNAAAA